MSRRSKQLGAIGLSVALTVSLLSTPAIATPSSDDATQSQAGLAQRAMLDLAHKDKGEATSTALSDKPVGVIVLLKDQPDAPSADLEQSNLTEQQSLVDQWASKYDLKVDRHFGYLINGFSATIPENKIDELRRESAVASVDRQRLYYPTENYARDLEGVSSAVQAAGGTGADGTGTVVSIIDTGIDPSHQDMKLDDNSCKSAKLQPDTSNPLTNCKVPVGYDYADGDDNFVYPGGEQHGMHVAGIVAANEGNGSDKPASEGHIKGAAPNAQVLAMKVFSDNSPGAGDPAIIAAIEDSVKLGADVINMSLGSDNGLDSQYSGVYFALEKAREAGVLPVVSAGNSGQNFSMTGTNANLSGQLDDAVLGSPSAYNPSFSVASVENSKVTALAGQWAAGDKKGSFTYQVGTGEADGEQYSLVDVGLGKAEDFAGKDVKGKYVLIQRGEIAFSEKLGNAEKAGAAGAIMFNHEAGGDSYFGMAGVEKIKIFSAVLWHSDGAALQEALKANPDLKVSFNTSAASKDNPLSLVPSDFTSWGPTPDLQFKPQIAGIGGNVWSTQNNNSYTSMSGTSMAAPNIAGLSAILVQEFKKADPSLSGSALPQHIEVAMMNTAQILEHDGIPYAPRQIGAGLAQVDKALATKITATVNGEGSAALGEFDGSTTFTVHLSAPAQEEAYTISVPAATVVGESHADDGTTVTVKGGDSVSASLTQLAVPAGTALDKDITFTVSADGSGDHYVQGWVGFTSTLTGQPELHVPFLGFAGDWEKEPVAPKDGVKITAGGETIAALESADLVAPMQLFGESFDVSLTSKEISFSPNADKSLDPMHAVFPLMRNADTAVYEVTNDATGQTWRIAEEHELRRPTLSDLIESESTTKLMHVAPDFDGQVWDGEKYVPLPDGDYTYTVKFYLTRDTTAPAQVLSFPFRSDATPPTIDSVTKQEDGNYLVTMSDASSALMGVDPYTPDGDVIATATSAGEKPGTYVIKASELPKDAPYVMLIGYDAGWNAVYKPLFLGETHFLISDEATIDGKVLGTASRLVKDGKLILGGVADGTVTRVSVNGEDAQLRDGIWAATPALTRGANTIEVVAYDAAGAQVTSKTLTLTYDDQPPVIEVTNLNEAGGLDVDKDGNVTVEGKITDERADAKLQVLAIAGQKNSAATINDDGTFSATVSVDKGISVLTVAGSDGANIATQAVTLTNRQLFSVSNLECLNQTTCIVSKKDKDATDSSFTVEGKTMPGLTSITFTPGRRAVSEGKMSDATPVTATVGTDGSFKAVLPAYTGYLSYNISVKLGDEDYALGLFKVYFDVKAPNVVFDSPTVLNEQIFTKTDSVDLKGSVDDEGFGYTFRINGEVVRDVFDQTNLKRKNNRYSFTFPVKVTGEDGQTILIQDTDAVGNAVAGLIPVTSDSTLPVNSLTADGEAVTNGERVDRKAGTQLVASASDEHLQSLKVFVNGELVDAKDTGASEESIEDNLYEIDRSANDSAAAEAEDDSANRAASAEPTDAATAAEGSGDEERNYPSITADELTAQMPQELPTQLSSTLDLSSLKAGMNYVTVVSTDLAGNEVPNLYAIVIDDTATISGPDTVAIDLAAADSKSWEAISKAIVDAGKWTIEDDGLVDDQGNVVEGTSTLEVVQPSSFTIPGTFTVTLRALGPNGEVLATKDVTVNASVTTPVAPGDGDNSGDTGSTPGKGGDAGSVKVPGLGTLSKTGVAVTGTLTVAFLLLGAGAGFIMIRRRKA